MSFKLLMLGTRNVGFRLRILYIKTCDKKVNKIFVVINVFQNILCFNYYGLYIL